MVLLAASGWASETVLHNFGVGTDGQRPLVAVIFDHAGNLYGTTYAGGNYSLGTVFEMTPNGSGGWTTTVLHSFGSGTDGTHPWARLVFDAAGNLYGTTYQGGSRGFGTVFEMSPDGHGGWTERVLHNFGISGTDGQNPYAALIFDGSGNLYSTTYNGGSHSFGTVFEMSPNGSGGWTERVLHNFGASSLDGQNPWSGVVFDTSGNLFGTGGSRAQGTVFEMTNSGGTWSEKVIHNFGSGYDGEAPERESLISDGMGNFYGTTFYGGGYNKGTAYKIAPNGSGGWTETILHSFGRGFDGENPYSGLIFDGSGNLYGTTGFGGSNAKGTVYEISPNGSGGWTETILHNFGSGADGNEPIGGVVFDGAGNLYGTTYNGGSHTWGTVYEITP
jgi:uncharacterized repeat protein (TIGR03803 family)